jgi:hypothetical protein
VFSCINCMLYIDISRCIVSTYSLGSRVVHSWPKVPVNKHFIIYHLSQKFWKILVSFQSYDWKETRIFQNFCKCIDDFITQGNIEITCRLHGRRSHRQQVAAVTVTQPCSEAGNSVGQQVIALFYMQALHFVRYSHELKERSLALMRKN